MYGGGTKFGEDVIIGYLLCSMSVSNHRTDDSANTLLYERGNPCMKDSDCDYYANSKCDTSCGLCKAPLNAVDPHKPPKN
uniref:ShKT domain-containing protein n=1 Tax=Meloidogyne incognita TaxID=6306 RepID=A0A914N4L9_MELIC